MALVYQNGITVNTSTGAIVGVGNFTGSGGNTQNTGVAGWTPTAAVATSSGSGGGGSAPVPPAGSYIINPGSTWQTSDGTGNPNNVTYGAPPAGFAAGVAPGVSAPAVATTPGLSSGYVWNGSDYVPLTSVTGWTQPDENKAPSQGGYEMGVVSKQGAINQGTIPENWQYITGDTTKKDTVADYAKQLADLGFTSADYSKYIIKTPDGKMYYSAPPMATLTSPTGVKKIVGVGTKAANDLLAKGWNLGLTPKGTSAITPEKLAEEKATKIKETAAANGSLADAAIGGMTEMTKQLDKELKEKDAAKLKVDTMETQISDLLGTSKSKESMQAEEERRLGIEAKAAAVAAENTKLKTKLAEINALTASYELQNTVEEGKTTTLARMQGAQAQNYRLYLAQKNLATSEASLIQANLLGLNGELEAAQTAASRSVDLRYSDQQFEINTKLQQLEFLKEDLTAESAEYADVLARQYKLQDMELGQQMDFEKADYSAKLNIIVNYGLTGVGVNSSLSDVTAAMNKSSKWIEENKPKGGTGTADNYFTRPKADGTIGYYFGNEKQPATAQEITQDQYNAGYYKTTPGESPEEKQIIKFQDDAKGLVPKLLNKEMTWGVAWDTLHTNYPEASADRINNALGGGIPFDPITGKFDTSKAWGTALKANK